MFGVIALTASITTLIMTVVFLIDNNTKKNQEISALRRENGELKKKLSTYGNVIEGFGDCVGYTRRENKIREMTR